MKKNLFEYIENTKFLQGIIIYYQKMKYTQMIKIIQFWFYTRALEILKINLGNHLFLCSVGASKVVG